MTQVEKPTTSLFQQWWQFNRIWLYRVAYSIQRHWKRLFIKMINNVSYSLCVDVISSLGHPNSLSLATRQTQNSLGPSVLEVSFPPWVPSEQEEVNTNGGIRAWAHGPWGLPDALGYGEKDVSYTRNAVLWESPVHRGSFCFVLFSNHRGSLVFLVGYLLQRQLN